MSNIILGACAGLVLGTILALLCRAIGSVISASRRYQIKREHKAAKARGTATVDLAVC